MSVAIVGDLHGSPKALERAAAIPGVTAIIQVGDFGIPPTRVPRLTVPTYFVEGNHEPWPILTQYMDLALTDGVPRAYGSAALYYVPRGTVLPIAGKRFLFAGGADSVDKRWQLAAGIWSDRETWTNADYERMQGADDVDAIVTHSPPQSTIDKHFNPRDLEDYFGLPRTWQSTVALMVEGLWRTYGCPPLYCGHMHRPVTDGQVRILDIEEIAVIP